MEEEVSRGEKFDGKTFGRGGRVERRVIPEGRVAW